jgi:hypothetical protein
MILRAAVAPEVAVTSGQSTAIGQAPQDHSFPVVECHPAARTLPARVAALPPGLPERIGEPTPSKLSSTCSGEL